MSAQSEALAPAAPAAVIPLAAEDQLDAAVAAANRAFESWKPTGVADRQAMLPVSTRHILRLRCGAGQRRDARVHGHAGH